MVKSKKIIGWAMMLNKTLIQRNVLPTFILKILIILDSILLKFWIFPFRANDALAYLSVCLPYLWFNSAFRDPWFLIYTNLLMKTDLKNIFPVKFCCSIMNIPSNMHQHHNKTSSYKKNAFAWQSRLNLIQHQINVCFKLLSLCFLFSGCGVIPESRRHRLPHHSIFFSGPAI